MPARSVTEIMTTPVATLEPGLTVAAAADRLAEHGVGAMPVVDLEGRYLGLLRDDDLLVADGNVHVPTMLYVLGAVIPLPGEMRHVEEELRKVAGATVADVMDADAPTIGVDASISDVATVMHEQRVTHIPVLDAGRRVVGVVARADIVAFIARTT